MVQKQLRIFPVAVTGELAQTHNLEEIGDLKSIEDEITAGFTLEFTERMMDISACRTCII